jgi:thiamine pyrophosphokinase
MSGVIVIGSGDFESSQTIKKYKEKNYTIIAADGGANKLFDIKVLPDYSMGDYDSISVKTKKWLSENDVKMTEYPAEKDQTDMEICIDKAKTISNKIVIIGGTGYRLDHTLINIFMLSKLKKENLEVSLEDDYNKIFIADGEISIDFKEQIGNNLSIIPLRNSVRITSEGLRYEVNDIVFEFGGSLGVSNIIDKEIVKLNILDGEVAVILSRDR